MTHTLIHIKYAHIVTLIARGDRVVRIRWMPGDDLYQHEYCPAWAPCSQLPEECGNE